MPDEAAQRAMVGSLGERIAEGFLVRRGAAVLGRNVRVGRGEVDLHVRIDGTVVAVEVKSAWRPAPGVDPSDHFDDGKASQLRSLIRGLAPRAVRVDLVTVVLDRNGATIRWRRNAA